MKFYKCIVIAFFIVVFNGCSIGGEDGIVNSDPTYENAPETIDEAKMLKLINDARAVGRYCGEVFYPNVGVVMWNDVVEEAALKHSNDMNTNNFFDHTGSDESSAGDRLSSVGYRWITYGENIAKGYSSEESVVEGWLNSSGHCANIMNSDFKEMGVAAVGAYWTQLFATGL